MNHGRAKRRCSCRGECETESVIIKPSDVVDISAVYDSSFQSESESENYDYYLEDRLRKAEIEVCHLRQRIKQNNSCQRPQAMQSSSNFCEIDKLREENKVLQKTINRLEDKVQGENDNQEFRSTKCEHKKVENDMKTVKENAECRVGRAEEHMRQTQCDIQAVEKKMNKMLQSMQCKLEKAQHELEDTKCEVKDLKQKLQSTKESARSHIQEGERAISGVEKEAKEYHKKLQCLQSKAICQAEEADNEICQLRSEMQDLNKKMRCIQEKAVNEIKESQCSNEEMERKIKCFQQQAERKIKQIEEDCCRKMKNAQLSAEKKVKQAEATHSESEQELRCRLQACQQEVCKEKETSRQLEHALCQQIKTLKNKLSEMEVTAHNEKAALICQKDEINQQLEQCKISRVSDEMKREKLEEKNKKYEEMILKLKQISTRERCDLKDLVEHYKSKFEKEKKHCCKLEQKINQIKQALGGLLPVQCNKSQEINREWSTEYCTGTRPKCKC